MSKYNAEQFIGENLVEFPKTKKEMIWCLNEFLKDTVKSISDDEMLKEKSTYRFHKHMVDYEMGLNEGFENGYDWTKKELIKQ